MNFTIGSDIEVFARNKEGKAIALCGMIGGSKENPRQLEHLPNGFMVQEDNVSLEYNIPAAATKDYFTNYITTMGEEVTKILTSLGLDVSKEAAISFTPDQLEHPQAKVFGCEPDYNAWTKTENKKPYATDKNLRTAGGHVHVGTNEVDMILGVRAMDLFLGVPSVILDNSPASLLRKELYGKAGAMRPKPYGWEYRSLSNFWMFDRSLIEWVYNNTKAAVVWARKGTGNDLTLGETVGIQECINTGNVELAKEIIAKYGIKMPVPVADKVTTTTTAQSLKKKMVEDFIIDWGQVQTTPMPTPQTPIQPNAFGMKPLTPNQQIKADLEAYMKLTPEMYENLPDPEAP